MNYEKAVKIATELFEGHTYGSSQRPMTDHLFGVVDILREFGYDSEEQLVVGIQHDTLEDTGWELSDLIREFGTRVAYAVYLCSDGLGESRKARKGGWRAKWDFARKICLGSRFAEARDDWLGVMELARRAKLADRLFNVRSCLQYGNDDLLKMYRKEHDAFLETILPDDDSPLLVALEVALGS